MAETIAELRDRILLKSKPGPHSGDEDGGTVQTAEKPLPDEKSTTADLHDGLRFSQFMIAGSVAGVVEHVAMFPVDTIKTRMQMMRERHGSSHAPMIRTFMSILKAEGITGLYRGVGAMILGAGPAHAIYFSVYEICKEKLGGNRPGHHPLAHAAAGICATIASDAVLTPMDVVKQRLQLPGNAYKGVFDCVQRMWRGEGLKAFYASYRTTVIMNAPFTATHFATYEATKAALKSAWPEKANEEHLFLHLTAGGAAGAVASIVTTPLDVVKTRLQCQGINGAERFDTSAIGEVVRSIVKKEGAKALLKGMKPRVLFYTPAAAICWSTYEATKKFLQELNSVQEEGGHV